MVVSFRLVLGPDLVRHSEAHAPSMLAVAAGSKERAHALVLGLVLAVELDAEHVNWHRPVHSLQHCQLGALCVQREEVNRVDCGGREHLAEGAARDGRAIRVCMVAMQVVGGEVLEDARDVFVGALCPRDLTCLRTDRLMQQRVAATVPAILQHASEVTAGLDEHPAPAKLLLEEEAVADRDSIGSSHLDKGAVEAVRRLAGVRKEAFEDMLVLWVVVHSSLAVEVVQVEGGCRQYHEREWHHEGRYLMRSRSEKVDVMVGNTHDAEPRAISLRASACKKRIILSTVSMRTAMHATEFLKEYSN